MLRKENERYKQLICPTCHSKLNFNSYKLICENCGALFPIRKGIPCFANGSSDWKLTSTDDSSKIIRDAKEIGWEKSLDRLKKIRADWIRGTDRFPIAFFAAPKKRVLDLGCGWGGLSFWMAHQFESVYGLDIELDGLHFIDIRASQEGVQNIAPVQGNVFSLPFPDKFFDVILLNGVLEWIGTFSEDDPPLIMQERALKEISRVLEPNGSLYVGIENRFGIQYFLGYKEEHTGLRFISLLPRKCAQIYHKKTKGKNYRALTHSRSALKEILIRSGFNYFEFFTVFPSYRNIRYAASLNGHKPFAFILKNFILKKFDLPIIFKKIAEWIFFNCAVLFKIGSFFSPSWIVFASKQKKPEFQIYNNNEDIKNIKQKNFAFAINNRRANAFAIDKYTGRLTNKYSIPINYTAQRKIKISKFFLDLLIEQKPELRNHVPMVTIHNNKNNYTEVTKAVEGSSLNINDAKSMTLFFDFLKSLSKINIPEIKIQKMLNDFDIRDKLTQLALEHRLSEKIIKKLLKFPGFIHGDLNKNNIYITNGKEKRTIILDFEHSKIGPFVLNWYDFICRNLIIYGGKYPLSNNEFLKRFKKVPGNKKANSLHNQMTVDFLNANNVPLRLHSDLTVLYLAYLFQDPIVTDIETTIKVVKSADLSL